MMLIHFSSPFLFIYFYYINILYKYFHIEKIINKIYKILSYNRVNTNGSDISY